MWADGEYVFTECAKCQGSRIGHKEDDLALTTCQKMTWIQKDIQVIKNIIKQSKHFETLFSIADFNEDIDKVR